METISATALYLLKTLIEDKFEAYDKACSHKEIQSKHEIDRNGYIAFENE